MNSDNLSATHSFNKSGNSLTSGRRSSTGSSRSRKSEKMVGFEKNKKGSQPKDKKKHSVIASKEKKYIQALEHKYDSSSGQKCENEEDDTYAIDFSLFKSLPKSVILDAIEYAKQKRRDDERKEQEKEEYKRLKCIPPWAKSYGGERLETCVSTATQYEAPSFFKLDADSSHKSRSKLSLEDKADSRSGGSKTSSRGGSKDVEDYLVDMVEEGDEYMDTMYSEVYHAKSLEEEIRMAEESYLDEEGTEYHLLGETGETKRKSKHRKYSKKDKYGEESESLSKSDMHVESEEYQAMAEYESGMFTEGKLSDGKIFRDERPSLTTPRDSGLESEHKESAGAKTSMRLSQSDRFLRESEQHEGEFMFEEEAKLEIAESEIEKSEIEKEEVEERGYKEALEVVEGEWEEETGEVRTSKKTPGKDTEYLKYHLGSILPKILAEIAWKQPPDPVHYLAHRLYCERRHQQIQEQMTCKRAALKYEREKDGDIEGPVQTFGFTKKKSAVDIPKLLDNLQFTGSTEDETVTEEIVEEQQSLSDY